jgi:hypothetical protein
VLNEQQNDGEGAEKKDRNLYLDLILFCLVNDGGCYQFLVSREKRLNNGIYFSLLERPNSSKFPRKPQILIIQKFPRSKKQTTLEILIFLASLKSYKIFYFTSRFLANK